MKDECEYCKKELQHGGQCRGKNSAVPCLIYDPDSRGRWERESVYFSVDFGSAIPKPGEEVKAVWDSGVDKIIKIYKIDSVEWNSNAKGLHGIIMDIYIGYWTEENGVLPNKPKLKLVK